MRTMASLGVGDIGDCICHVPDVVEVVACDGAIANDNDGLLGHE